MVEFKSEQSKAHWRENSIQYIAIIVILIIILVIAHRAKMAESKGYSEKLDKMADGNGPIYEKARGNDDDTVEDLLNRIQWATYLEHRKTSWYTVVAITVIIVILICLIALRKLPKPAVVITMLVITFVVILAVYNFHYVHGEIYNDYYIMDNVKRIRKELFGDLNYQDPPPPQDNLPTRAQAMNPWDH